MISWPFVQPPKAKIEDYKRNDIAFYLLKKKASKPRSKPTGWNLWIMKHNFLAAIATL